MAELQEQVDRFDTVYNTQRPHQALPGRITPQQAWDATPTVPEPHPTVEAQPGTARRRIRTAYHIRVTPVGANGTIDVRGIRFQTSRTLPGHPVAIVNDDSCVMIFDLDGTLIVEHPWPAPGIRYVGNGLPCGPKPQRI